MPKNTGRGGRNYRRGPHKTQIKRELVLKEEGNVYGQVQKMLGSGRVQVYCFDEVTRTGNIRGKMKRRVRNFVDVGLDRCGRRRADQSQRVPERQM